MAFATIISVKVIRLTAIAAIVRYANQWLLAAVLTALFVAAAWFCVSVWQETPSMPLYRNVILGSAAILMLVTGCGLIGPDRADALQPPQGLRRTRAQQSHAARVARRR